MCSSCPLQSKQWHLGYKRKRTLGLLDLEVEPGETIKLSPSGIPLGRAIFRLSRIWFLRASLLGSLDKQDLRSNGTPSGVEESPVVTWDAADLGSFQALLESKAFALALALTLAGQHARSLCR